MTSKGITYTNKFKLQFIVEYKDGKNSRKIFENARFNIEMIGVKLIDSFNLRL